MVSFLLGVCLYSFFNFGSYAPAVLLCIATVLLLFVFVKKSLKGFAVLVCAVFMMFGCIRMLLVEDVQAPFVAFDSQKITLQGDIISDPDQRETSTHLTIRVKQINDEAVSGVVLAIAERNITAAYGDVVYLRGKIALPKTFETKTGKEFDYPGYLRSKGIGAVLLYPHIQIERNANQSFLRSLYDLKHALERSIELTFPEPAAGLLKGILLGNKAALGDALYQMFVVSGLVHIVVLSGYNLTIVSDAFIKATSFFSRRLSLILGALGIILFALMVGGGATVVRASIMALIVIFARALNRPAEMMRMLFLACVLMVLHNPLILTHDPSFVLSFLAAFGLMTLANPLEGKLFFIPEKLGMRAIVSATLSTQLFLLPALIFYTGALSLVALPANLLALPVIPITMLFGFLASVAGLLHPFIAYPFMIPAWALLSFVVFVAQSAALIPSASITVSGLQSPYIFILYVILLPLSVLLYNRLHRYGK